MCHLICKLLQLSDDNVNENIISLVQLKKKKKIKKIKMKNKKTV